MKVSYIAALAVVVAGVAIASFDNTVPAACATKECTVSSCFSFWHEGERVCYDHMVSTAACSAYGDVGGGYCDYYNPSQDANFCLEGVMHSA